MQKCQEKVAEMRNEMGQFWLYNIYDTCDIDQALPPATPRHKHFDEWCAHTPTCTARVSKPDPGLTVHRPKLATSCNGATTEWRFLLADDICALSVDRLKLSGSRATTCRFELTPARTYRLTQRALAGLDGYKCGAETSLALYLADDSVQKAIHVEAAKGKEGQTYTLTVPDLRPLYTCASRAWLLALSRPVPCNGKIAICTSEHKSSEGLYNVRKICVHLSLAGNYVAVVAGGYQIASRCSSIAATWTRACPLTAQKRSSCALSA